MLKCVIIILLLPLSSFISSHLDLSPFLKQYVFDYKPGDVFGCMAVLGWITGHSYVVYGPLCNGATTLLFEGTATHPDNGS